MKSKTAVIRILDKVFRLENDKELDREWLGKSATLQVMKEDVFGNKMTLDDFKKIITEEYGITKFKIINGAGCLTAQV
jgi:hypothetical protein